MRFLILGASGLVGSAMKRQLEAAGHEVTGTYCVDNEKYNRNPTYRQLEAGDITGIDMLLEEELPDVVISAMRGEFDLQMQTHEWVMQYCRKDSHRKIIFVSTLNVFDNDLSKMHVESEKANPESTYGVYKAKCEDMFLENLEKSQVIILRIPSVWSEDCRRVQELKEAARNGEKVKIWTPLIHNYTTPEKIGEATRYILDRNLDGIFHLGTVETMDYAEFYCNVVTRLGLSADVLDVEELSLGTFDYGEGEMKVPYYQCLASERKDFAMMNDYSIEEILTQIGGQIIGGADKPTEVEWELKRVKAAKYYIGELFKNNADGHDAAHSLRVYHNAMAILEAEITGSETGAGGRIPCDKEVVALAALLHDVDDHKLFRTENNANARLFLTEQEVPEEKIELICEIINGVSFSKNCGKRPATLEGKIVQDADRLDALGAIGIARTFAYGGKHGRSLDASVEHFYDKLLLLKDEMNTAAAKNMAEERHTFLEAFLEEYRKES